MDVLQGQNGLAHCAYCDALCDCYGSAGSKSLGEPPDDLILWEDFRRLPERAESFRHTVRLEEVAPGVLDPSGEVAPFTVVHHDA